MLCICTSLCEVSAQAYKKIDLDLDAELIDLVSLEDDHVHLITSTGIYDFNILTPSPIALLKEKTIGKAIQNYAHSDTVCFFPLKEGGYISYNKNHKVVHIGSGNPEGGILLESINGHKWLAKNSLHRYEGGKWNNKADISLANLTDGKAFKDILWLCSATEGVYRVDNTLKSDRYTRKKGLLSDDCSSLHVINAEQAIVGHKGGLSLIRSQGIKQVKLNKELGAKPVLELEMDNAGKLWLITKDKLMSYKDGQRTIVDLELSEQEQLVSIHLGSDQNIWVLSNQSIYIIPNTEIQVYNIPRKKDAGSLLDFYQIRSKNYVSDGKQVFSLNNKSNRWELEARKDAPNKIINDENGNPNLIFKNKGLKLSTKNARKMNRFSVPEQEELININLIRDRKYYSTKTNFYEASSNELKLLSYKEDNFYKVIETSNGLFVFAQNGIYKIQNEKMVPLLATYQNTIYPFSVNQFGIDDKLFVVKDNSIQIINTIDESIQEVTVRPLKILDIKVNGTLVWLFCSKSIVALDKQKLSDGEAKIVKVIPIYQQVERGQMYKQSDKEIWAMSTDKIFRINVNDPITAHTPEMHLHRVSNKAGEELKVSEDNAYNVKSSDLPLNISYNGSNFWTDNISYSYHLNYNGKNISEWSSDNSYTMNKLGSGKYTLNAKFKDDIYGINVHADKVSVNLNTSESFSSKGKKKWLPIIVISSLILCFLFFLTSRKSEV